MASVIITLTDTPTGGVAVHTDYKPAVGNPCTLAQSTALDVINRTRANYGLSVAPITPVAGTVKVLA